MKALKPDGTLFRRLLPETLAGHPSVRLCILAGVLELPAELRDETFYPAINGIDGADTLTVVGDAPRNADHAAWFGADGAARFTSIGCWLRQSCWQVAPVGGNAVGGLLFLRRTAIPHPVAGTAYFVVFGVSGIPSRATLPAEETLIDLRAGLPLTSPLDVSPRTRGSHVSQILERPFFLLGPERFAVATTLAVEAELEIRATRAALNVDEAERTEAQRDVLRRAAAEPSGTPFQIVRNRARDREFDAFCRARSAVAPLDRFLAESDIDMVERDAQSSIAATLQPSSAPGA